MRYAYSTSDTLVILTDAFRESVHIIYADERDMPDNQERPLETHNNILTYLADQYPVIKFYSLSHPMSGPFHDIMRSDYFNAKNKNDTIDMIMDRVKLLRNSTEKAQDPRLESAKFVLALLSAAYDQIGPR